MTSDDDLSPWGDLPTEDIVVPIENNDPSTDIILSTEYNVSPIEDSLNSTTARDWLRFMVSSHPMIDESSQQRAQQRRPFVIVLKEYGPSPSPLPATMKLPPFRFCNDGNILETIDILVQENAPLQELLWAHTWAGNESAVRELLTRGVYASSCDDNRYGAIHFAAVKGYKEILVLLIKASADVNQQSIEGNTALQFAAAQGHFRMVGLLLFHRANVNQKDCEGRTALHFAVTQSQPHVAELLLLYGADTDESDREGRTALRIAREHGDLEMEEVLLRQSRRIKKPRASLLRTCAPGENVLDKDGYMYLPSVFERPYR